MGPCRVELSRPLPGGEHQSLDTIHFDTGTTGVRVTTTADGGFASAEVGYDYLEPSVWGPPRRVYGGLPRRVAELVPFAHVVITYAGVVVFEGRVIEPRYVAGEIVGFRAEGYIGSLDDRVYTGTHTGSVLSGKLLKDVLAAVSSPITPAAGSLWGEPGVGHTPSELTRQTPGQIVQQILKEGGTDGYRWHFQVWEGRRAWLVSESPPTVPTYAVPWDRRTELTTDYTVLRGRILVEYTPAGGSATTTEWSSSVEYERFQDRFGLARELVIPGDTLTATRAAQFRDTERLARSDLQWSGTITREGDRGLELEIGGEQPSHLVRAGGWVQVLDLPLLLIRETDWSMPGNQLTVKIGTPSRDDASLFQHLVETSNAVRAGVNPNTGAKRS